MSNKRRRPKPGGIIRCRFCDCVIRADGIWKPGCRSDTCQTCRYIETQTRTRRRRRNEINVYELELIEQVT